MVKLFVEGGGDAHSLKVNCRKGFNNFLSKAGLSGRMPRIIACGSRQSAYDDYCTALSRGEIAYLLVDSEDPVDNTYQTGNPEEWNPWGHLNKRDNWDIPSHANNKYCHLMTQSMETWLLADKDAIKKYYGQGFNQNALPTMVTEDLTKNQTTASINNAIRHCTTKGKNSYSKGKHSFEILQQLDPTKVSETLPWSKRFVDLLCNNL